MPDSVSVPTVTLRELLRLAREGISPGVHWSESREKMDTAAMRRRTEIFHSIEAELEPLIPD